MDIFKDKVATVTGGGSGIGRALCERLARLGAKVVLSDINPKSAEKVGAAIRNAGGKAVVHTLDVTDYNAFFRAKILS